MKFTGEFFIPQDADTDHIDHAELEIEHRQRYLSILKMVEGKIVLDIASGEGYGTSILSSKATQVFGVDINETLVEHAGQKYTGKNIRFLHGAADKIPLGPHSVDVIVSFETLEHLSADTQNLFMREVKRVLKPDGVLIVSTPNKKNYTDRYQYRNEFHLHELYRDDFEKLLNAKFNHVLLYEQGLEVASMILREADYLSQQPVASIPVNHKFHFEGKYLIGVCSDLDEAVRVSIASIVPESEKSYFQIMDRILQLQQEVGELGAWGKRSNQELEASNTKIRQLQQEMEELGAWGKRSNQELEASNTMIRQLQQETEALTARGKRSEEALETSHTKIRQLQQETEALTARIRRSNEELEATHTKLLQLRQDAVLAEEEILFYKNTIQKLQEDLAQSNHNGFLKESELAAIQKTILKGQSPSFEMEKLTGEITRLIGVISRKETGPPADPTPSSIGALAPSAAPAAAVIRLQQQIVKLQEELQWYKRTYEERSMLGVIKQKITAKFHK